MATTLNAGTTTGTSLQITPDTTGAMVIQTSGANAISISNTQVVTLANALPAGSGGTGITSLGTGVATFLGTPSSANLAAAVTDETGSGALVFGTSPTISSPSLTGTPTAPTATAGTNTTQVATTAFVQTAAGAAVPSGSLLMWPTTSAPSGYLLCDGTAVSRTTYAGLYAVVGTTFGTGDGSTTFNLPDYRDRMPIGAGTSYSVNSKGGSKDAIVVSHTHTISDSGHAHTYNAPNAIGGGPGGSGGYDYGTVSANTGSATTGISINSTGSSGTNANLPPYLGIYFVIKT